MLFSIALYSPGDAAVTREVVRSCLGTVAFQFLRVSRTIGPCYYYAVNKALIEGRDTVFPPKDISGNRYESVDDVTRLLRPGSTLKVAYGFAGSDRLLPLSDALSAQMPDLAKGFYLSEAYFCFGPHDIVAVVEDEAGEQNVNLVAVTQCSFNLLCDDFHGNPQLFAENLPRVSAFPDLRSDIERITGPMQQHVSM